MITRTINTMVWVSMKAPVFLRGQVRSVSVRFMSLEARPKEIVRSEELAEVLGVSPITAEKLMKQRKALRTIPLERIKKSLDILTKYGFPDGRVISYPGLLTLYPLSLESQILVCKESNINYMDVPLLLKFRELKKLHIRALRVMDVIPDSTDVVSRYVEAMRLPAPDREAIYNALQYAETEAISLKELRLEVLAPYLSVLLKIDEVTARNITKRNTRFHVRPFSWMKRCLEILDEKFEYPREKLIRNPFLLMHDPAHLLEIADKVKMLGGRTVSQMVKQRAKLLSSPADALLEINGLLDKFGIPAHCVSGYPEVFMLSPETVEERLIEMTNDPDLLPYLRSHRVGRVLYLFNRLKRRRAQLQKMELPGAGPSLHAITQHDAKYNAMLKNHSKCRQTDAFHFFQTLYFPEKSLTEIRDQFAKHPHYLDVPIRNMQEVMKVLLAHKEISLETIFDALPVVLYPPTIVASTIEQVISEGHANPGEDCFLQMVLYFLEKPSHFNWDGIWAGSSERDSPMYEYHELFEKQMINEDEEMEDERHELQIGDDEELDCLLSDDLECDEDEYVDSEDPR